MAKAFFTLEHKERFLVLRFEALEIGMLQNIGYDVKKALQRQFLRGQELFVRKDRTTKGRRVTAYSITKRGGVGVKITSLPLNIWERPFTRRGRQYAGKHVFSQKLPPIAQTIAQTNAARYMGNLAKRIEKGMVA